MLLAPLIPILLLWVLQSLARDKRGVALEPAIARHDVARIGALVGAGINANVVLPRNRNLLMVAVTHDDYPTIKLLRGAGANPDPSTELFLATIEGDETRVAAALDKGANVNSEDYDGGTALFFAVARKRVAIVRFLLQRGARVNHQNQAGWTALMYALNYLDPECTALLLARGANPYLQNKNHRNAWQERFDGDLFPYQAANTQKIRALLRRYRRNERRNERHSEAR